MMVKIDLRHVYKRYILKYIIRDFHKVFESGTPVALTGRNGSGKSTLLKIIAGMVPPTKGEIIWTIGNETVKSYNWYRHLGFVAPYLDLYYDLTFDELLKQYIGLMNLENTTADVLWDDLQLFTRRNRPIRQYSSGMIQKLRLGLAFIKKPAVLLLDEPASNLDSANTNWYYEKIESLEDSLIIVASNDEKEYSFAKKIVSLSDYS